MPSASTHSSREGRDDGLGRCRVDFQQVDVARERRVVGLGQRQPPPGFDDLGQELLAGGPPRGADRSWSPRTPDTARRRPAGPARAGWSAKRRRGGRQWPARRPQAAPRRPWSPGGAPGAVWGQGRALPGRWTSWRGPIRRRGAAGGRLPSGCAPRPPISGPAGRPAGARRRRRTGTDWPVPCPPKRSTSGRRAHR